MNVAASGPGQGPRKLTVTEESRHHRQVRVTTRTGDDGYTSLLGQSRVPKYHPQPEAYGTVDEATSALGLGRALSRDPRVREIVYQVQQDLYIVMAELAATPEARNRLRRRTTAEDVARLEAWIEEIKGRVEIAPRFVMPGDSVAGAAFDLARTVIRRAERLVARLVHEGHLTNREILRYLNRASDLAFVIARLGDASASG